MELVLLLNSCSTVIGKVLLRFNISRVPIIFLIKRLLQSLLNVLKENELKWWTIEINYGKAVNKISVANT